MDCFLFIKNKIFTNKQYFPIKVLKEQLTETKIHFCLKSQFQTYPNFSVNL